MLEIKDEILTGDPRYTIQDNDGQIIEDNVQITLKTAVAQEGTPLNKATLDTFKIETVGASLLMNGGSQQTYGIYGELKKADFATISFQPTTSPAKVANTNFVKVGNETTISGTSFSNKFAFTLDDTHSVLFAGATVYILTFSGTSFTVTNIGTITGSATDIVRLSDNKFIVLYGASDYVRAIVVQISSDFTTVTSGSYFTIVNASDRNIKSNLVAGNNCFFVVWSISYTSSNPVHFGKFSVSGTTISKVSSINIGDAYSPYISGHCIADMDDKVAVIWSYNTSNGGSQNRRQLIYDKTTFTVVYDGTLSGTGSMSINQGKLFKSGNYYVGYYDGQLYRFLYNTTSNNFTLSIISYGQGTATTTGKILGTINGYIIADTQDAEENHYLFINDVNNSPKNSKAINLLLGDDNKYGEIYECLSEADNGYVVACSVDYGNATYLTVARLNEIQVSKATALTNAECIVASVSGQNATVYQSANTSV